MTTAARWRRSGALVLSAGIVAAMMPTLQAQSLGTFRWQLQPFCNAVTVNVIQQGSVYTLEGYDDQCGAPQRAPLVGVATPNPDGTIGFGLHLVTVPGGRPVHVEARIALASLGGPWTDSAGNSGNFVFNGAAGGSPRPQPTIPAGMIAPGSITAAHINAAQVQARVTGVCPNGLALRGVNPDGTVACTSANTTVDDPVSQVGSFPSVAIGTDGLPIIAHWDITLGVLRVTHCGNAACTDGNESFTADDPANTVGGYPSLRIGTDGLPVIAHRDTTAFALRVTHCGNILCSAGNISTTVDDQVNTVASDPSLAIGADGLPVISHGEGTANRLRVTHCGNVTCSAGNTTTGADDPADSVGNDSSIAIGVDGLPVISHWNATVSGLRVTHCGNAACTAGNVSTTVDDVANQVGVQSSLAIGTDGLPLISHADLTIGALRVTHCGNVACTAGTASATVDDIVNVVGRESTLAIGADGLPIIGHQDTTATALRVTHCGNATCTAGNVSTTVYDPVDNVGADPSIAIGPDGLPVLAHRNNNTSTLVVTKCGTRTCA